MIKKTITILILSLILFSCYHENKLKVKKPENLISVEQMTNIITDLQIAEGVFINNRTLHIRMEDEYKDSLYSVIFEHYGISSSVFTENVNYYNTNPALMEKIYDHVLENLNKMQSEIENEAKDKADTIVNQVQQKDSLDSVN